MAGILEHIADMSLVTNPLVNSYKRLVPGFLAPLRVSWSVHNSSPLIRLTSVGGDGGRIILRSPDGAANPYLVLAACLAAWMVSKEICSRRYVWIKCQRRNWPSERSFHGRFTKQ